LLYIIVTCQYKQNRYGIFAIILINIICVGHMAAMVAALQLQSLLLVPNCNR
jgi:hypothetical protein